MPMLRRFSLLTCMALFDIVPLLLRAGVADAQSIAKDMQDFGLFGTWAAHCDRTPSPANEHAVISVSLSGTIQALNDFGPDYDDMVYGVVEAERLGPDRIRLRQVLTSDPKVVLDIVMLRENGRLRVWSSRSVDGAVLVRDGTIAQSNRQSTQWVARCQDKWAVSPAPTAH